MQEAVMMAEHQPTQDILIFKIRKIVGDWKRESLKYTGLTLPVVTKQLGLHHSIAWSFHHLITSSYCPITSLYKYGLPRWC